jgi:hypothetical protein
MTVADSLSNVSVLDTAGRPVTLGALWADRPLALVFIRHYG